VQLEARFLKVAHDPGDPVMTSHCPFCGSGQITGRSDGGIDCAFCGQSYIVRVQPAFSGMPQAPGMGAPTDVGPDMGAMGPPGMEEGGGMPPGMEGEEEGFPPGEEDEEGGPPFGEEEEGEEGPPGAEEENGEEGEEENTPPPPRNRKKSARTASVPQLPHLHSGALEQHLREHHGWTEGDLRDVGPDELAGDHEFEHESTAELYPHTHRAAPQRWYQPFRGHLPQSLSSRRYRTVTGDLLPEDAYVRHLAVLHSGRDPAVMARVRRQAYLTTGDTPHHRLKYEQGYDASAAWDGNPDEEGHSPLEYADFRGEPDSWYQGYMDHATDRPFGHAVECPAHDHDQPGCTLIDYPEKFDPAYTRRADTAWLGEHRIQGRRAGVTRRAVHDAGNHEDMSEAQLRAHMRDRHGFYDSPEDPGWLIDQTHRDEHADAPLEHSHPDLSAGYERPDLPASEELPLSDKDWLHQHGIEGSRRNGSVNHYGAVS